jgi:hypothetical protein
MGRPVVYCDKCGRMLREDDFDRGQAHLVENRSFCIQCRPLESRPVAPLPPPPPATPKPFKQVSSTRIPRAPSGEYRQVPHEPLLPPPPPPDASRGPLVIGLVIAGIAVVVVGLMMMGGGRSSGGEGGGGRDVNVVSGTRGYSRDPDPSPGDRPSSTRDDPAKAAYSKAAELQRLNPADLVAQFKAFDEILQNYGSSGVADIARREVMAIRKKFTDELGLVSDQARVSLGKEEFKAVIDIWERAKTRYQHPEWTGPAGDKIREANEMAVSRFGTLRAKAGEAKKIGDLEEVKKQRERVARWGLKSFLDDFDQAMAEVTTDKPEAPDKPPPPAPKGAGAYAAAWREAVLVAARREYEAAAPLLQKAADQVTEKDLKAEAARDLEDLGLVCRAGTEGRLLLSKLVRGQKVSLAYTDESGNRASVEGTVAATDGQRIEVKRGEETVLLLAGEVSATALTDLFRGRPAKLPTDARAAALLCLLEGDAEAAKRISVNPPLPEKYTSFAAEAAEALKNVPPRELEARKLFAEAEGAYFDPLRAADAVRLYKSLLADYAETGFVRRNKAAMAARTDGGKEYYLSFSDMTSAGFWKTGKVNTTEAWMSTKDQEMAQLKDNYIQIDFSALADTEYRLWVLVGGCCQEVLTFFVQGTDLSAPNPKKLSETIAVPPGGEAVGAVKMPYLSLKRKHSDHTGPKAPEKWEWVQVPLPKYPAAGAKSVRLLTVQKGFSVASALVTALRTGPPKEKELTELERSRAETPGFGYFRNVQATGGILREWWLNIDGGEVALLTSNPNFPDKPSGSKVEGTFAGPVDVAQSYGTRMRGWVHPPVTGNYIFWIAADDTGELWLSSDDTPDKRRKIASVPQFTGVNEWTKHASQQSEPIGLVAGKRYYIEALHKQGAGGDNISVGWQLPDGKQERPIPGNRLSPWKKK